MFNPERTPLSPSTIIQAKNIACDLELFLEEEKSSKLRTFKIIEKLKQQNLLDQEVLRAKALFGDELKSFGDDFDKNCWEMLAVLNLFDEETATHCVNTFLIAKSKVEKTLWNGIILADEFKRENVKLSEFYRACVFHDIGKIEVPHSVLVNQATDEMCVKLLFENQEEILIPMLTEKLGGGEVMPSFASEGDLFNYLSNELRVRPQALTPVKLLLDKPIPKEVIHQLNHCGCSVNDSLLKIMQTHDHYSKNILKELNFNVEGELAGAHHTHRNDDTRYNITIGTLKVTIDLADIVHLADVENAILSKRHYKPEKTSLEVLKILSNHSQQGLIGEDVAYIWIADEIHTINKEGVEDKDKDNFNFVKSFLDEEKKKHTTWISWDSDHDVH
jgi:response regulator RpfG family c-di-GMP phosphodiesterase